MQNIAGSISQKAGSLLLVALFFVATFISGCESPGSVGSGLTDSGAEVDVLRDTIAITSTRNFNSFSGNYRYISAGAFDDPQFGEISATGFLKPALPTSDSLFTGDTVMKMRLLYNTSNVYGDTLAAQSFDVYRVEEFWRPNAIRLMDELQLDRSRKVASFTVGEDDSLEVPLDAQWVNEHYRPYAESDSSNADSSYKNREFGLALVPANSNKVVPVDMSSTRFVIETPEEDTTTVSADRWAYQMTRKNQPTPPSGTTIVHNMLEQVLSFDMAADSIDISGPNVSRAELIFYQDESIMSSSLSGSRQRPQPQAAQLHFVNPEQSPDNLLPGNPVATGTYSTKDNAFHFEVTRFLQSGLVNGLAEGQKFYITLPNNGIVQSSLIYTGSESMHPPELVITYLKNTSN